MNIGFSVADAVTRRFSVRTYDPRPLEEGIKQQLLSYAASIHSPLGPDMRVQLLETASAPHGEKLGTYGVIKGASLYLCATIPKEPYCLESLGYAFEQLVLHAAGLGLGTCWLGGTFNRSAFTSAVETRDGEIFPIISPVGYPAKKQRLSEQLFRRTLKADARLPWERLFFRENFQTPLQPANIGPYQFPLEMLRLAPSAVNKQPWRILFSDGSFHFFEKHTLGAKDTGTVDMQRIDIGIAACHFHLAAMEAGLSGYFERRDPSFLPSSPSMSYITSWIANPQTP